MGPDAVVARPGDLVGAIAAQRLVFAPRPARADLLALPRDPGAAPLALHVVRNQAFEPAASVLAAFLDQAGWRAAVSYGPYDDALTLADVPPADAYLVWLDFARYRPALAGAALAGWLAERLDRLRLSTPRPILVALPPPADEADADLRAGLAAAVAARPGMRTADLAPLATRLGAAFYDPRAERLSGTRIAGPALVAVARQLAFEALPPLLRPRLRAIAVDLDGTLHDGVLGEDGPAGVALGPGRREVHAALRACREAGVFLGLVTRNDPADVEALFAARPDFPLRRADFASVRAGWGPKAEALAAMAAELGIAPDAILFVDDNPGELAAVAAACPGTRWLIADDAAGLARALAAYPGLQGYPRGQADALRLADAAAAPQRARAAAQAADPAAYRRSLGTRLAVSPAEPAAYTRLHELSMKTNQFNTGLRRLGEAEIAAYASAPDRFAIAVALADRLADSGLVAALFGRREGDALLVDEACISCRALGRGLETPMLEAALLRAQGDEPAARVEVDFRAGPRNAPARDWLVAAGAMPAAGPVVLPWSPAAVRARIAAFEGEVSGHER